MTIYCVGLTGGIGSGKSAVAARLAAFGASIIDTDGISRDLTGHQGGAIPAIRDEFGPSALAVDGSLNRAYMRHLVFDSAEARRRLEALLHPMIREVVDRQIAQATGAYVVLVVPLLVETGQYTGLCHRIVAVTCPLDMRIMRVMARSGLTSAEVRRIAATQATDEQRLAVSDEFIENVGTLEDLSRAVEMLHRRLLVDAQAGARK